MPTAERPRPFRFAVAADGAATATGWRELARRAEGSGYDLLATTDHVGQAMAPFTALATAAAVTTTLRVGTYVLCHALRGPVVLAKELATLDLLSDGRAEAGLGGGWMREDHTQTGAPFGPRAERFARFAAYVDIVAGLLAGETVTHEGEHFSVSGATCVPRPVQPRVPLLVGGSRERVVRLAARRADTVSVAPTTGADGRRAAFRDTEIDVRAGWVREAAAGRDAVPEIDLAVHQCRVVPRRDEIAARLCEPHGLRADEIDTVPSFLVGSAEHVAELLVARRERWGASRVTVPADAMDAMAPVVARLAGT